MVTDDPDKSKSLANQRNNNDEDGVAPKSKPSIISIPSATPNDGGTPSENLGTFNRISSIILIMILTCIFLGLSGYCFLEIKLSDFQWADLRSGKSRFPNVTSTHSRRHPYFEMKRLDDLPLGKMLKEREDWKPKGVYFGLGREAIYHFTVVGIVALILFLSVVHLLLVCCLKKFRRKFMLISIGYGVTGIFMFLLFMATLYSGFIHKTSCYLENSRVPPEVPQGGTDFDKELFVNLTLSCAFAYSVPNHFAKYVYPTEALPLDGRFTVEGMIYSRNELMDLGLCPRQDYLIAALVFLFLSGVLAWLVSSMGENMEHRIMGPPMWLKRFKVKTSREVPPRKNRIKFPSYLELYVKLRNGKQHATAKVMKRLIAKELTRQEQLRNVRDDAYAVLDGRQDPLLSKQNKPYRSFSETRFYPATTNLVWLTSKDGNYSH